MLKVLFIYIFFYFFPIFSPSAHSTGRPSEKLFHHFWKIQPLYFRGSKQFICPQPGNREQSTSQHSCDFIDFIFTEALKLSALPWILRSST